MLQLAQTSNFPPYLFARYILEALCTFHGGKSSLTDVMRNPSLLLSVDSMIRPEYRHHSALCSQTLVYQVQEAVNADPLYGPLHDKGRHLVGVEFEVVLSHKLKAFSKRLHHKLYSNTNAYPWTHFPLFISVTDIPFETEAQLRQRGTSRTPDILLSAPVGFEAPKKDGSGYEWKIVCWIDSKVRDGR